MQKAKTNLTKLWQWTRIKVTAITQMMKMSSTWLFQKSKHYLARLLKWSKYHLAKLWQGAKSNGVRIKSFFLDTNHTAASLLIVGCVILVGGFGYLYLGTDNFTLRKLVTDLYANGGAELLSIGITVIVIDGLNRRRATQERKIQLFRQIRSRFNMLAVDAVEQVQDEGWWEDFLDSRRVVNRLIDLNNVQWSRVNLEKSDFSPRVMLFGAELERANLMEAELGGASLGNSNLKKAQLQKANLKSATLGMANLTGANLTGTNLIEANLETANLYKATLITVKLQGANLERANLEGAMLEWGNYKPIDAQFDENTKLPNGTFWTQDTDMEQFTNPNHIRFYQSPYWAKNKEE